MCQLSYWILQEYFNISTSKKQFVAYKDLHESERTPKEESTRDNFFCNSCSTKDVTLLQDANILASFSQVCSLIIKWKSNHTVNYAT